MISWLWNMFQMNIVHRHSPFPWKRNLGCIQNSWSALKQKKMYLVRKKYKHCSLLHC